MYITEYNSNFAGSCGSNLQVLCCHLKPTNIRIALWNATVYESLIIMETLQQNANGHMDAF